MKLSIARCALFLGIGLSATLTLPAQNISPQYNPLITSTHSYQTLLSLNNDLYGGTQGRAAANDCSGTPVKFKGKNVIYVAPGGNDNQDTNTTYNASTSATHPYPLASGSGANSLVTYLQGLNQGGSAGQLVCFETGTYQPFSITQSGKSFTDLVRFEVVPGNIAKVDLTCGGSTNPTVDCPNDFIGIQVVPPARFNNPANPANYVQYVLVSGFYVQGPDENLSASGFPATPSNTNNFYNTTCIQIMGNQGGSNYVANQEADHIYIVANTAVGCPSGGIGAAYADYITIDGNTVYDNNWYGIYGASAIGIGDSLDTKPNDPLYKTANSFTYKNYIVNNTVFNNIQFSRTGPGAGFSPNGSLNDGEGIVIDTNLNTAVNPNLIPAGICPPGSPSYCTAPPYSGYTLISGNQVFGNGSSGIEATYSQNVDITFNTTFNNGVQPLELNRAEIEDYDSLNMIVASNLIYTGWDTSFGQGFDGGPNGVTAYYNLYYVTDNLGTVEYVDNTAFSGQSTPPSLLANYPVDQSTDHGDSFHFANGAYAYGYTTAASPYFAEYATPTDTVFTSGGLAIAPTSDPYIQNSTRYLSLPYDILGNPKPSTTQTVAAGAFNVAY